MRILGIDTSTDHLCIAVLDDGVLYEYRLEAGRRMSVLITEHISRVLEVLKLKPEDIDYFACGLGPGSFTGLRVGAATIKGLSYALNKPVAPISTLDILADQVKEQGRFIIPAIDAKRGLVYCCIYKNEKSGLKKVSPYMLLSKEEFIKKIKPASIILGDAIRLYRADILRHAPEVKLLDKDFWYPRPGNIISLALKAIRSKKLTNAFKLEPIYLYPKECQIRNHCAQK
ncbi:MAG: tRNA (adenosine(37)-N6)-threonylcarbamoyltransferase complex dimerization subunit type 1 TsaB [Candidatus Omnitrophica bacterium]|nr:tRNA (adenosine(37)-N6)-threonylcarbamoyltransferase complex dimerization subunit type 1 TsaB [Candidatus Omnitrophota bacterium]